MIHNPVRHDPATALIRAVLTLARGEATLEEHRGTSWASATFSGMRHAMRIRLEGEAAVATGEWLAAILPEHEFALGGHLVADMIVSGIHRREEGQPVMMLSLEALTVEAD